MKNLIILCLFLAGCTDRGLSPDEYFEACPYELKYGRSHYLEVPITMIPHKKEYQVGDTLTVRVMFSDSIMDLSRQTRFKIENFPFEPINLLYKVEEDNWESGFRVNELLVDELKYNTRYNVQSFKSDDLRGFTVYEDEMYLFEYKLVFNTPGTYVSMMSDQYEVNQGSGNGHRNEEADALPFEGKCPESFFYLCNTINGDPHLEDFLDELVYLDKVVYRDNLSRIENIDREHFGTGGLILDWIGAFCFKVT